MTIKFWGLLIATLFCGVSKYFCLFTATLNAVFEFYFHYITHPWSYYILLLMLSFSFFRLETIFKRGAIDEQLSMAKPKD
jgi:hypothetical protein